MRIFNKINKKFLLKWLFPIVLVIIFVLFSRMVHISTLIQANINVDRVVFKMGSIRDDITILNSIRFNSINIRKFDYIELEPEPETIEIATPIKHIEGVQEEQQYSASAWESLSITSSPIRIKGKDEVLLPAVSLNYLESEPNKIIGTLDRIYVKSGAEVILSENDSQTKNLTVRIISQRSNATLSVFNPSELITNYCQFEGITPKFYDEDLSTYRIYPSDNSLFLKVKGQQDSMILKIYAEEFSDAFYQGSIPITEFKISRQGHLGNLVTSLVSDGEINYPDYPEIPKVTLKQSDFILIEQLNRCEIKKISMNSKNKGIQICMQGVVGDVRSITSESEQNYRLTLFDKIWQSPTLRILFIIIPILPKLLLQLYNFIKENIEKK